MIAVADASPLCYLVLIGEIDLLPKIFLQVAVPEAVVAELLHEDAPEVVRNWASTLPAWISTSATADVVSGGLGVLGEAATRGLVDLASAIDRLRKTTFRCSPALLKTTLDRFGASPAS